MNFYLSGWKNRQDVKIPPVSRRGFSQDIIIRKSVEAKKKAENVGVTEVLDDRTLLLLDPEEYVDEEATVILSEKRVKITVIRMKTGEEKEITRDSFVLGKAKDCDFVITGNPTISRYHARIRKVNGDYILEDMNSLNHTYVDSCEVTEAVRVMKDLVFQMSDEEFKVSVEIN